MYFTRKATTKQGKKLLKQADKKKQKKVWQTKTPKYTAIEMEETLHSLGQLLEETQQKEIQLVVTLHDTEGKVEKEGTNYVFGPLTYQVSEGYYPTLVDVIKRDLLKETDETMSVEDSFRNEKLLSVVEEALEENEKEAQPVPVTEKVNREPAPWERPIVSNEPVEPIEETDQAERDTDPLLLDAWEDDEPASEEDAWAEEAVEEETSTSEEEPVEPTVPWTEPDAQVLVDPVIAEAINDYEKEIQRRTTLETIQALYPPEEAWMKEKNQLYLNQLYTRYELPQTYQAFLEGKGDLIRATKQHLIEQWEQAQSLNWEEIALEDLAPTFEERQTETEQTINDYAAEQAAVWTKTKETLEEEQARAIEAAAETIKVQFKQKEEAAYARIEAQIQQFTEENQQVLSKEKAQLLADQINEQKRLYFQELQTEKVKSDHALNEQLLQLSHATNEAITEKQTKIQQNVRAKGLEWKKAHERDQRLAAERQAQAKKEQQEQEALAAKRNEQALKEKEQALKEEALALEKQRLDQERERDQAEREARKSQQKAQLEQLRQAQLHYFTTSNSAPMNPVSPVSTPSTDASTKPAMPNGWMMGCLVSVGLLLGGSSVFVFHQLQQPTAVQEAPSNSSETVKTEQVETEQVRKAYEDKLAELLLKESTENSSSTKDSVPTESSETKASEKETAPSKASETKTKEVK